MYSKIVTGFVLVGLFAFGGTRPAHAQFAVIDVGAIAHADRKLPPAA